VGDGWGGQEPRAGLVGTGCRPSLGHESPDRRQVPHEEAGTNHRAAGEDLQPAGEDGVGGHPHGVETDGAIGMSEMLRSIGCWDTRICLAVSHISHGPCQVLVASSCHILPSSWSARFQVVGMISSGRQPSTGAGGRHQAAASAWRLLTPNSEPRPLCRSSVRWVLVTRCQSTRQGGAKVRRKEMPRRGRRDTQCLRAGLLAP